MSLRILFVPLMEVGHTNPLIGVMQRLLSEGHELACFGTGRELILRQFSKASVHCSWYPREAGEVGAGASARKTALLTDRKRLFVWSALGVNQSLEKTRVAGLRAAIGDFRPDVVCADPMAYHGPVAAELEGVPWAALSPLMVAAADPEWRCPWLDVQQELQPLVLERMHALGVKGIRLNACDAVSPWLNMLFVTEAFAPRAWSKNTRSWYLGPSLPLAQRGDESAFPWARLRPDVPIVYVSGGGGQALSFAPETFLAVCGSLAPTEAQFVCAVQGLFEDEAFVRQLSELSVVVRNAPQLQILKSHAAVVVTHGGINSVTECLVFGRPMLVLPVGHEQPLQARAVESRGVGLHIDVAALSPENCREALLRLLDPAAGFRQAMQPIQDSYRVDGAGAAASLLARLARAKEPLDPPACSVL